MPDLVRITVTFEADLRRLVRGAAQLPAATGDLREHIEELYWIVPNSVQITTTPSEVL